MNRLVPVVMCVLVVAAYALFYLITASESSGASALDFTNMIGLVAVFVGLIAAGLIFRRATPVR